MRIGLRNRGVAATSAAGIALRAAQLLGTLVTVPILIDRLGLAGFGLWGAATSLLWLTGMLDLGIGSGLVVTLPFAIAAGRPGEARDLLGASLFIGLGATIVLLAAGVVLLLATDRSVLSNPFAVAAAALALNIPLGISARAWLSVHKGYVANVWEFAQTVLALGLIVWGALGGASVTLLVMAVYGALLAANAASLAHFLGSYPELRPVIRMKSAAARQVVTKGALLFAAMAASMAAYAFDNILALAWLGPIASGQMTIALRVCTTAAGFLGAVSQAFWPAFVDAVALGDKTWIRRTLRNGFWILTGLSVLGSAALGTLGGPLLRWWLHRDIHLGAMLFWSMACWITLMSLPLMPSLIVASGARLRALITINVIATAAALTAKAPLAGTWGAAGILIASPLSALLVSFPLTLWLALRSIRDFPQHGAFRPLTDPR